MNEVLNIERYKCWCLLRGLRPQEAKNIDIYLKSEAPNDDL